jgi:cystathionine beta-lyase
MRERTRLVAFDPCPGDPFGSTCTPIYQTATFDQDCAGGFGQYDYTRSGNPTRDALESQIAMLEGLKPGDGGRCFAFASGLAAITAVMNLLGPGDEILACDDLYGGTYRLLSRILARRGVSVKYADLTDLAVAEAAFTPRTKLVFIESVSNPLMRVCDIRKLAELTHSRGARLCVDNTFLSPLLMKPLALGADFVVHSATKYLSGHSDVTAGCVTVADKQLAADLYLIQNGEGAGLSPQDSYLLLRGLKTLDLRLEREQRSANVIAHHLLGRKEVTRVLFPGLPGLANVRVHAGQSEGTGAVVCFETGDHELSLRFVEALKLFGIRVSFGSVGSSASMPCHMSHASIPEEVRKARNFPSDIVRLSIGIEDVRDLIADIEAAFELAAVKTVSIEVKPSATVAVGA